MLDQDACHQDAIQQEALSELRQPQIRHVQVIDVNDESLSPAFRRPGESPEEGFRRFLAREKAREAISLLVQDSGELPAKLLKKVSPKIVSFSTAQEQAAVLNRLIDTPVSAYSTLQTGQFILALQSNNPLATESLVCKACNHLQSPERAARLFERVRSAEAQHAVGDSLVRGTLREIAHELEDPELRQKFLNPELSDKELFEVLRYTTQARRINFLTALHTISELSENARSFLADKLDNIIQYAPVAERVFFIKHLLELENKDYAQTRIEQVLRASANLKELISVVDGVGKDSLLETGNPALKEYVAHTVITRALRNLQLPEYPRLGDSPDALKETIQDTLMKLVQVQRIVNAHPELKDTQVAKDAILTSSDDIQSLVRELREAGDDQQTLYDVAARALVKLSIELEYGVNITVGESEPLAASFRSFFGLESANVQWTLSDLYDIRHVLSSIPEGHVLFTPNLRQIERVDFLGFGVLGARYRADGVIKIASITIGNRQISEQYGNTSSLRIVLAHEIGHGLQIGDGLAGIYLADDGTIFFGSGEEITDFDEYIRISDWKIWEQGTFSASEDGTKVIIDGVAYDVGRPVQVGDKELVFTYHPEANILISFDNKSEFSSRWYSKTSPWEDFAEAFSEYIYLPERLIIFAPQKFRHLDQEYGKYRDREDLKELLKRSLERHQARQERLENAPITLSPTPAPLQPAEARARERKAA